MRVPTNVPHLVSRLGVWGRIYSLTEGYYDNIARLTRKDLDAAGVSPDYWYIIVAVRRWRDARVPFPVVYILWAIRESIRETGAISRRPGTGVLEAGVAYRYIQLASHAGECLDSDKCMGHALRVLRDLRAQNGGIRGVEFDEHGEIGTTARAARVLLGVVRRCSVRDAEIRSFIDELYKYISNMIIDKGEGKACWARFPGEDCYVGSTALAVHALVEYSLDQAGNETADTAKRQAERGVRWILENQLETGGWSSRKSHGSKPILDTTFNALRAIVSFSRIARRLGDDELISRIRRAVRRAYEWLRREGVGLATNFYNRAFAIRLASILRVAVEEGLIDGDRDVDIGWLEGVAVRMLTRNIEDLYSFKLENIDFYYLELFGIAILEFRDAFAAGKSDRERYKRELYRLPRRPPRILMEKYLASASRPSEILLFLRYPHYFDKFIMFLIKIDILSIIVGKLLGAIVSISMISDLWPVLSRYTGPLLLGLLGFGLLAWQLLRLDYLATLEGAADILSAALVASILAQTTQAPQDLYSKLIIFLAYLLIIDVVSWTADKSLLLRIVRGREL